MIDNAQKYTLAMNMKLEGVLIDSLAIQKRVAELACQIAMDYGEDPPVLLPVLTGSFMFASDLTRNFSFDAPLHFVKVSSYGSSTVSNGKVSVSCLDKIDVSGRRVLIIEDIVDTGHTIKTLVEQIKQKSPKDVKVVSLLDKPERRQVEVSVDYVGFVVPNKFIVGYGLDCDEHFRCLKDIYTISEE